MHSAKVKTMSRCCFVYWWEFASAFMYVTSLFSTQLNRFCPQLLLFHRACCYNYCFYSNSCTYTHFKTL